MASPRLDDLVSLGLREAEFIKHNSVLWVYGQGFSKGTDVSKQLDAQAVREWLDAREHGLTAAEVRKVISAAVNGEAMPETYRPQHEMGSDRVPGRNVIGPAGRTAGALLISQLESKYGEMPKRVKVGDNPNKRTGRQSEATYERGNKSVESEAITAPATPLAAEWEGYRYGLQSLKPSAEVILVFQKSFDGKPVDSIVRWGVGAVAVDRGRIRTAGWDAKAMDRCNSPDSGRWKKDECNIPFTSAANEPLDTTQGRYPSNFIISHAPGCEVVGRRRVKSDGHNPKETAENKIYGDLSKHKSEDFYYADADGREEVKEWRCVEGCPVAELDRQSGESKSNPERIKKPGERRMSGRTYAGGKEYFTPGDEWYGPADTGTASRFFYQPEWSNADIPPFKYQAKASTAERNAGVYAEGALCYVLKMRAVLGLNSVKLGKTKITQDMVKRRKGKLPARLKVGWYIFDIANRHPTVKPVELMKYFIELFIGKGRIVLDPFAGSGTTLIAGLLAGVNVLGIDADWEYCQISEGREKHWTRYKSTYLTTGQIPVVKDAALPLFEPEERNPNA